MDLGLVATTTGNRVFGALKGAVDGVLDGVRDGAVEGIIDGGIDGVSDGELDEGSNWEAFMFAAHHKLDNLVGIIDYNKLQSLTSVADTLELEPLVGKLEAFGWAVNEVDGHDLEQIECILGSIPWKFGKPSALIAHTTKGKGVSFMENKVEWHYKSPNDQQLADALREIEVSYA